MGVSKPSRKVSKKKLKNLLWPWSHEIGAKASGHFVSAAESAEFSLLYDPVLRQYLGASWNKTDTYTMTRICPTGFVGNCYVTLSQQTRMTMKTSAIRIIQIVALISTLTTRQACLLSHTGQIAANISSTCQRTCRQGELQVPRCNKFVR